MHAMQNPSLCLLTELIFWRRQGRVEDRGDHVVVATPSQPDYYFGNLLYFSQPPAAGDVERWRGLFREAFAAEPRVRHETFMWDVPAGAPGEVAPFLDAGFELEENVVLATGAVQQPPHPNPDLVVRRIETEAEWAEAVENQVRCRSDGWPDADAYRAFAKTRMHGYRALAGAGLGGWYGAFLDGALVGDLGLFRDGAVARFQNVGTHPDHRGRGVCGTLVHAVSTEALGAGVEQLVMIADEHYHAARIYESVGFRPTERTASLCRRPD
jgi:GNAT superfamily N-acetyltransferase